MILASGETKSGDEVYIYGESRNEQTDNINSDSITRGKINAISKKHLPRLSVKGELVGISKISL